MRTLSEQPPEDDPAEDARESESENDDKTIKVLDREAGFHRVSWDLYLSGPKKFPGMILWNDWNRGPQLVPGTYRATLHIGDWQQTQEFVVIPDPRLEITQEQYEQQFAVLREVCDKLSETNEAVGEIQRIRKQLKQLAKQLPDGELSQQVESFQSELESIEQALYQTQNESRQDPLNFPIRLNDKLAGLGRLIQMGAGAPTKQALRVQQELTDAINTQLGQLQELFREDLPAINKAIHEQQIQVIQTSITEPEPVP